MKSNFTDEDAPRHLALKVTLTVLCAFAAGLATMWAFGVI